MCLSCLRVVLNLGCLFDTCDECKYKGDNEISCVCKHGDINCPGV